MDNVVSLREDSKGRLEPLKKSEASSVPPAASTDDEGPVTLRIQRMTVGLDGEFIPIWTSEWRDKSMEEARLEVVRFFANKKTFNLDDPTGEITLVQFIPNGEQGLYSMEEE